MNIILEGRIGQGFVGLLHHAREDGKPVLVEVLTHPERAGAIALQVEQTKNVSLTGVLQAQRMVELPEGPAVLYEGFSGLPLSVLFAQEPSARAIVSIFSELADVLHASWAQPVGGEDPLSLVHGGLELCRIWVDRSAVIKVEGIGQAPGSSAVGACAPPEHAASHAGDVFSLGWLLAWALLGERPSLTLNDDVLASDVSILVVRIREKTGDEQLAALLEDMLRFSPSARPPASRVRAALKSIAAQLNGASLAAWAAEIPVRAKPDPAPAKPEPAPTKPKNKRKSRLFRDFSETESFLDDVVIPQPARRLSTRPKPPAADPKRSMTPPVAVHSAPPAASSPDGVDASEEVTLDSSEEVTSIVTEDIALDASDDVTLDAPPVQASRAAPVAEASEPEDVDGGVGDGVAGDAASVPAPPLIPPPSHKASPDDEVEELELDEEMPEKLEWKLHDATDIDSPEDWETSPVSSGVMLNPLNRPKDLSRPQTPQALLNDSPSVGQADSTARSIEDLARLRDGVTLVPDIAPAYSSTEDEAFTRPSQSKAWMLFVLIPVVLALGWMLTREPPADPAPADADLPVDAEPVDAKPADAEPVDAEPVDAEPVDAEPVDAEPSDAEPADAEPADAEPEAALEAPPTAPPAAVVPSRSRPTPAAPATAPAAEERERPVSEPAVETPAEPSEERSDVPVETPEAQAAEAPAAEDVVEDSVEDPTAEPAQEPAVSLTGEVVITGDAFKITLQRDGSGYGGGTLPAGRYEVMATFTEGGQPISSGSVQIQAGEQSQIDCNASFMRCQIR